MDEKFDQAFQQAAAFQKMWTDAFTQMGEVWGQYSPGNPPPDTIRDMRAGMLKVLTEAWDQFARSPQFMEYMKTSMDGFMDLRKMSADAMTRNHHEMQSPAREDIDGILLAIRHMERRLLDRIEDIESAVAAVGRRGGDVEGKADQPIPSEAPNGHGKPAAKRTAKRSTKK
jgi:hypothetical protein